MPDRMIRAAHCRTSVPLLELSAEAERLYWRLTTVADDTGRFEAESDLVRASCFARSDKTPALRERYAPELIEAWIIELAEKGIATLYVEDGQRYGAFVPEHWPQRLRESKPKFPAPPSESETLQPAATCGESRRPAATREPSGDVPLARAGARPSDSGCDSVSTDSVAQDATRARSKATTAWQLGARIGDLESGELDTAFIATVRTEFPGLCEHNFRGAAVALVWKRRVQGTLAPRFLSPLDGVRSTEVSTVRLCTAIDKYLKEKSPEGPQAYSIEAFVGKLGHWLPRARKPPRPSPAAAIPDEKPERSPEAVAAVKATVDALPFMRRDTG